MIPTLTETVLAGVITMLSNGIGGLPFVFVREFPITVARLGWSIAGGMMLSASEFNLIIPGVTDGGITPVAIGVLIGTVMEPGIAPMRPTCSPSISGTTTRWDVFFVVRR